MSDVAPPRLQKGDVLLIAGFAKRLGYDDIASIPQLWQRLGPHIGRLPNEISGYAYGVIFNNDDEGFEYLAGVALSAFDGVPDEFTTFRVPAQTYAVFVHHGHISAIKETMKAIWTNRLPESGLKPLDAPSYERYGPSFDPRTGNGDVEIFMPVHPPEDSRSQ